MSILSSVGGLLILGVAILVALRLVYLVRGPEPQDPIFVVLFAAGWFFILAALCVGSLIIAGFYGIVLILAAPVVGVIVYLQRRMLNRRTLLSILAISTESQLPMASALNSFATDQRGALGRWARRIAELLESGCSLPDALQATKYATPQFSALFARIGEEVDGMGDALRETVKAHAARREIWFHLVGRFFYLVGIVCVGLLVGLFMLIKIIPELERIYWDFSLELPLLTRMVLGISNFMSGHVWIILALGVLIGAVALAVVLFLYELGWIRDLPFVGRLPNRCDAAVVLHALALAAERQRPMRAALVPLAHEFPRRSLRSRLSAIVEEVSRGADWCDRLHHHRIIGDLEHAVLHAAQRVDNLPWALREMGDRRLRNAAYRWQAWSQLIFPGMLLIIGAVVMFFVVGMFLPLVDMIGALS